MLRRFIAAVAALTVLAAQPASAKQLLLAPTDEWRLLENDASCELIRRFGTGDDAITLLLELSGPEAHFSLSAYGEPLKRVGQKEIELRFGPAEAPTRRAYLFGRDGRGTPFVIMHGVDLVPPAANRAIAGETSDGWLGPAREAAIAELTFSRAISPPITLQLGPMGQRLKDIRSCAVKLAERLQNGPVAGFSRKPEPLSPPGDWMGSADYPLGLMLSDVEGRVSFRLVVSSAGKPVACHIESVTNSDVFNDAVCASLIRRARFSPAQDSNGKPVSAYWRSSVRFVTQ